MKKAEEMSLIELNQEMTEIMKKHPKDFSMDELSRAEDIRNEYIYKKDYEPRNISRFDAGVDMFNRGL